MLDSALRRRLWVFTTQGEDLPQATNRIDLDPSVRGKGVGRVLVRRGVVEIAERGAAVVSVRHGGR